MADTWCRGVRDGTDRPPPRRGEDRDPAKHSEDRRDRHLRIGIGHPSGDPARHRVFEVRAAHDAAAGGWVARVAEQNPNEQREACAASGGRAFASPAACFGDAVAGLVALVDREAAWPA